LLEGLRLPAQPRLQASRMRRQATGQDLGMKRRGVGEKLANGTGSASPRRGSLTMLYNIHSGSLVTSRCQPLAGETVELALGAQADAAIGCPVIGTSICNLHMLVLCLCPNFPRRVVGRCDDPLAQLPSLADLGAPAQLSTHAQAGLSARTGCQATRKWAPFDDNTDSAEGSIPLDRRGRRGASTA
jgi:hypothetical protein